MLASSRCDGASRVILNIVLIASAIATPITLSLYWWSFARLHLRMERAWAVALSVIVIGLLGSMAAAYWIVQWAL